ncbi:MAG TPA: alpha-E domain-containing protein [Candidatus Binatia bacterium]|nr:alpha-E domain-containing protein [Candidatus Binatia bacterium]
MLSRVADSLYWMSRYIERAENVARFIDVNLHMMLDLPVGAAEQWGPLVITTGDDLPFAERYGTATREKVIQFLTFDKENPNSIISCLRAARENARSVREIISSEMWEQVNTFYLMVTDSAAGEQVEEAPYEFFREIKMASHLFEGLTNATMSHSEGWHFCRLGRLLERADKTSRILDVKYFILLPSVADVGTPFDDIQWAAVLRSTSAFEMYRKRYHHLTPDHIVDFLLLDREFPRSIHYCLIKADESLHAVSDSPVGTFRNPAEQYLGQLRAELAYAHVQDIITGGLHEFLDAFQTKLNVVGDSILATFFALQAIGEAVTFKTSGQQSAVSSQYSRQGA